MGILYIWITVCEKKEAVSDSRGIKLAQLQKQGQKNGSNLVLHHDTHTFDNKKIQLTNQNQVFYIFCTCHS